MNILIIEDDLEYAIYLKEDIMSLQLSDINIIDEVCTTKKSALRAIERYKPHLLFLDIELDERDSGIKIAKAVSAFPLPVPVIYLTGLPDIESRKAYNTLHFDFLRKDYDQQTLKYSIQSSLERAYTQTQSQTNTEQLFFTKNGAKYFNLSIEENIVLKHNAMRKVVDIKEVRWIEAMNFMNSNHKVKIKIANQILEVKGTLKKYLGQHLRGWSQFVQVHRSFIINREYIDYTTGRFVYIEGIRIPIGRSYKKKLK